MRRAGAALNGVHLCHASFDDALTACQNRADVFYLDPPYVPVSQTASFTAYVPGGWGAAEQERLASCVRDTVHGRGGYFVLSNSWTDAVCDLYAGFRIEAVKATRMINCNGERRGAIDEAIVRNYLLMGGAIVSNVCVDYFGPLSNGEQTAAA